MTRDLIQTVISTRVENPLTDDEIAEFVNDLSDGGLGERQAEAFVRFHFTRETGEEIADSMDTTTSNVYSLKDQAHEKLTAADRALAAVSEVRRSVRPE